MGPSRARLADGRWHLQHGPIDLIVDASGSGGDDADAIEGCWAAFGVVLPGLVAELPLLRRPIDPARPVSLHGPVARRMLAACLPHAQRYITPMAAVAGAVADHLLACFDRPGIRRAYLNNGGDIALLLREPEHFTVGLFTDLARLPRQLADSGGRIDVDGRLRIEAASPVRGVATSGWRGRSFSLGIADSVTVLAADAAAADAAATMIANAVDADDPRILRRPARQMKDDTDLGDLRVTVDVPSLPVQMVDAALAQGEARACELISQGLIHGAILACQGRGRAVLPAGCLPAPAADAGDSASVVRAVAGSGTPHEGPGSRGIRGAEFARASVQG